MRKSNWTKKRNLHLSKGILILFGLFSTAAVYIVHLNKIIHKYQLKQTDITSLFTNANVDFILNSKENNHHIPFISSDITDSHSFVPNDVVDTDVQDRNTKNDIQVENELSGSRDWVLSKPAVNREIEGYLSRTSINRGENISLYYNVDPIFDRESSSPGNVIVEVFRTGWYNGVGARKVHGPIQLPRISQMMPKPQVYGLIACNWSYPYVIQTDRSWTTGVYLVKMTENYSEAQSYAIFVLRNDRISKSATVGADIIFQLPFNTYQAYNRWGSRSLYGCYEKWGGKDMKEYGRCEPARKVSFDRPYAQPWNLTASFGLGAGEYLSNVQPFANYPIKSAASWNYNMVRWLEKNNIDVTYISNTDVHTRLNEMSKPKLLLTQGHDEYWSWSMRDNVMKWRDEGVHMAFLGSNTAFWQIRYEDISANSTDYEEPRTIVCFRWPRKDSVKDQYRTLKWRDVGRPEALMVGVEYIFPLGDPFDEDLIVSDHSHWIFNGTGVKKGDKILGILGYEVDRIENTIASKKNTEETIPTESIAKLFETPLVNRLNKTIVAQSSFFTAKSGAHVFGAGTMQWSWGLDDYGVQQGLRTSRLSSVIEKMTWNMFHASGIHMRKRTSNVEAKTNVLTVDTQPSNPARPPNMDAWMYEPNNVDFFWKKMGDRPFQAEFYSKLGKFNRILDIGVRGYNRFCKDMINSTTTQYFQIDPFPPKPEEMNNDGILECYVQDVREKFPRLRKSFDLVIDFGVFGWEPVLKALGVAGVREYIQSILFLMNDDACWALKIDWNGWCDSYNMTQHEFMNEFILPYFRMGDFDTYKSGHSVRRGNFLFYWFYKISS